jgi:hypothetical protein
MSTPAEQDLLDIQAKLRADEAGTERAALQQRLQDLQATLKRKLDAGVPPAEFAVLNGLADAAAAADEVVGAAWTRLHGQRG